MKTVQGLLTALLLGGACWAVQQRPGGKQASGTTAETRPEESKRLLALGKQLFVERCASCHGDRGQKPLRAGPPLNQRQLTPEDLSHAVDGRLKSGTEEQRRAVVLYIQSILWK